MSNDGLKTTWKPFFWLLFFRDVSLRAIGTWFSVFRPCIIYLKIFVLTCFLWSWDISGWTIFHISSIKNWFKAKHVWIWCFSPVKRVSLEFGKIQLWFSIEFPHLKEPLEGRWDSSYTKFLTIKTSTVKKITWQNFRELKRPNGIPRGQGPFKLLDVFF